MQLDFSSITNSPLYEKELGTLKTTGKQKLWVIAVMIILPPLWIPLIIYALFKIPEAFRRHKIRQQAIVEFAQKNDFSYKAIPYVKSAGQGLADKAPDLPYQVDAVYDSGRMGGMLHGMNFEYVCGGFVLPLPNHRSVTGGKSSPDTKCICSLQHRITRCFSKAIYRFKTQQHYWV